MEMTPEQKEKYLKAIERIEHSTRPEKWRLIKKLTLDMKPWLKQAEQEHSDACKDLRQKHADKFAASTSGTMRNNMKLFYPVYANLVRLDPELRAEMSGRNQGDQLKISKQLWDAFPEWRICREF